MNILLPLIFPAAGLALTLSTTATEIIVVQNATKMEYAMLESSPT